MKNEYWLAYGFIICFMLLGTIIGSSLGILESIEYIDYRSSHFMPY